MATTTKTAPTPKAEPKKAPKTKAPHPFAEIDKKLVAVLERKPKTMADLIRDVDLTDDEVTTILGTWIPWRSRLLARTSKSGLVAPKEK